MLVSKLSDVKSVEKLEFENALTRILRREGWEINDLSPLSWQLFWDFTTFGLFSKVCKFLKQNLVSRKLEYLNFGIMRCLTFLNLVFRKRRFCCRKLIVFSCLQFADCYIWSRFFFLCRGVILRFYSLLRNLFVLKSFLRNDISWCCRKHVFVFEIASLKKKSLSEFMIKLSFSLWLLGEKIWVRHYGQSFENFSVLGVDFLCLF
jgi:hypothetical protein